MSEAVNKTIKKYKGFVLPKEDIMVTDEEVDMVLSELSVRFSYEKDGQVEYPELNDEFAKKTFGLESMDQYKDLVRTGLREEKEDMLAQEQILGIVLEIVKDSQIGVEKEEVEKRIEKTISDFKSQLEGRNMDFDSYLESNGITMDTIVEDARNAVMTDILYETVIDGVAALEGITVSDEEVDTEIQAMAADFGMTVDEIEQMFPASEIKEAARTAVSRRKAGMVLLENVVYE